MEFQGIWTKKGLDKLSTSLSGGSPIIITHFALGDGNGVVPLVQPSQIELINEVHRANVNSVSLDNSETGSSVIVEIVIPYSVGGFFIREWGLFDEDGDLIAVAPHAEFYKPVLAEGSGAELVERIQLPVSSTSQISITVSHESLATVRHVAESIDEHNNDAHAHEELLGAHDQDPNAHTEALSNILKQTIATTTELGLVSIGEGLAIEATGEISVNAGDGLGFDDAGKLKVTVDSFPTGTLMLFRQSAAPTGWIKETSSAYNNAALRFTTGNVSNGGSLAFTSAFASRSASVSVRGNTGSVTLSTNQMPSHSHGIRRTNPYGAFFYPLGENFSRGISNFASGDSTAYTNTAGSSSSHNHSVNLSGSASLDMRVKYVDVIVARKA